MGSLISEPQRERVMGYVEDAVGAGASLACGGKRRPGRGYFLSPALLTDVTPWMRVMREEIFGPVVAAYPFADERRGGAGRQRQRVRAARARVWTSDAGTGRAGGGSARNRRRLDQLERLSVHLTAPSAESSRRASGASSEPRRLDAYTETKTVYQAIGPPEKEQL